jgi:hypothetical protein
LKPALDIPFFSFVKNLKLQAIILPLKKGACSFQERKFFEANKRFFGV